MTSDTPRLDCRVTPAHLPAGGRTTLTLTARNRTQQTIRLKRLTVTLPRGGGAGHLLTGNAQSVDLGYEAGPWRPVRADIRSPDRAVEVGIERSSDALDLHRNDSVEFRFTFTPNNEPHAADATITETTDRDRSAPVRITKTPQGFRLANLRPRPHVVEANHCGEITWETDRGPSTVGYDLAYTMDGRTLHDDVSKTTAFALWPREDTNVKLTATVKNPPATPVEAVLTCFITVIRPWLRARSLSAVRRVDMLGARYGPGPVPGFGRQDPERYKKVTNQRFRAETDGILTLSAEVPSGRADVTVDAQLLSDSCAPSWTLTARGPAHLTFPVPADATVLLNAGTSDTKDATGYLLTLDWHPLGSGQLTHEKPPPSRPEKG